MNLRDIYLFLAWVFWLSITGCGQEKSPEIVAGIDGCALCNMTITQANQACGFYWVGEFVTFDSPGCLVQKMGSIKQESGLAPSEIYFADFNTSRLIPADSAYFLLTEHLSTTMNSGVLCFTSEIEAAALMKHPDEMITDWIGYWTRRGTADRCIIVFATQEGFNPDIVILYKGELVQWEINGERLTDNLAFHIEGYDEVGEVTVPASEEALFRMLAIRPGAGFPIINSSNNESLGMIKVEGAHTEDEEAM